MVVGEHQVFQTSSKFSSWASQDSLYPCVGQAFSSKFSYCYVSIFTIANMGIKTFFFYLRIANIIEPFAIINCDSHGFNAKFYGQPTIKAIRSDTRLICTCKFKLYAI